MLSEGTVSALIAVAILIGALTTLLAGLLAGAALILTAIAAFLLLLTALTILIAHILAITLATLAALILLVWHCTSSPMNASEETGQEPPERGFVPNDAASCCAVKDCFGCDLMFR